MTTYRTARGTTGPFPLSPCLLALLLAVGCTDGTSSPEPAPIPPAQRILAMDEVEALSETVANRLIDFSNQVRKRDFRAAGTYLSQDFLGTRLTNLPLQTDNALPLEAAAKEYATEEARRTPLDRAGFMASLEEVLAPLESVEYVFFKTRGAEFDSSKSRGVLRLTANIIGRAEGDQPHSVYAWAQGEVTKNDGEWFLRRFVVERMRVTTRSRPLFTDVASVAGLSHRGPRLSSDPNASFYWRGAATADIDGDGFFDIFNSNSQRGVLYRNNGNGTFADISKQLPPLPSGMTGSIFFDYDRDGDQDLFCGYVGWKVDGVPNGESLKLLQNDGAGKFTDVTREAGLAEILCNAFSSCVADIDNDGWLDIYVCSYNRLDAVYPNSWHDATNGTANVLLHNQKGKFVDVAPSAKTAGKDWSYAAAFADFDEDGDQDIYVANDYGNNRLYRNEGDGTFVDVAAQLGVLDTGNGMGVAWGDLNQDGRLDLYVSNMSSSAGNRILRRLGKREAEAAGSSPGKDKASTPRISNAEKTLLKLAAGNTIFIGTKDGFRQLPARDGGVGASWAWSTSLLDIDLDGRQDIYVANGFISGDSLKDT